MRSGLACACLLLAAVFGIAAAFAQSERSGMSRAEAYARAESLTRLGRQLFFDPRLSASGQMACASCHDPQHGFGPSNSLPVQLGGRDLRQSGLRAVPSLKYLQVVPQFTEHYFDSDDEGDSSIDNGPTGGLTWDGRVDRRRDQARVPLLSSFEMANSTPAEVIARLRQTDYGHEFQALYGPSIFGDEDKAFAAIGEALAAYQEDSRSFYPYSSKYDAYLAGRAELTPQETRGLSLFESAAKGNCASCHRSRLSNDGTPPQFTDYGLIALGLPRNQAIAANADPTFFDLGLCGPLRTDLAGHNTYCGLFRTPTLRNVALRRTFFHNGLVHDLRQAVAFYVERDTDPQKWYPRASDGSVRKFDDLPQPYWSNVNTEPPFGPRPGNQPALTAAEVDDIVAFLQTLTDGYDPPARP